MLVTSTLTYDMLYHNLTLDGWYGRASPLAKIGFADRRESATLLGQSALGRLAWILGIMLLLWAAVGWALDWWS